MVDKGDHESVGDVLLFIEAALDHWSRLLDGAAVPLPEGGLELEMGNGVVDDAVQLLGPVMATLNAAGVCAELLAIYGGVKPENVVEVRAAVASGDEARQIDLSPAPRPPSPRPGPRPPCRGLAPIGWGAARRACGRSGH